ncbi:MAG: gamma-glutamylcyclotransferase [Planctomycetes bacterium]|nr:gamma-glutamylcyclotransferase [Planctomycetota bacterium]MCB9920016.1 gamma-glutamylcyclotransferase [Planctomycetota bacterium]
MSYVFVYGTLRRGGDAFDLLKRRARFLGPASVAGRLYDHGPWPSATLGGDRRITGDLFALGSGMDVTLTALDAYEGSQFRRVRAEVQPGGGDAVEAWMWVWNDPAGPGKPVVPCGDWHVHIGRIGCDVAPTTTDDAPREAPLLR